MRHFFTLLFLAFTPIAFAGEDSTPAAKAPKSIPTLSCSAAIGAIDVAKQAIAEIATWSKHPLNENEWKIRDSRTAPLRFIQEETGFYFLRGDEIHVAQVAQISRDAMELINALAEYASESPRAGASAEVHRKWKNYDRSFFEAAFYLLQTAPLTLQLPAPTRALIRLFTGFILDRPFMGSEENLEKITWKIAEENQNYERFSVPDDRRHAHLFTALYLGADINTSQFAREYVAQGLSEEDFSESLITRR